MAVLDGTDKLWQNGKQGWKKLVWWVLVDCIHRIERIMTNFGGVIVLTEAWLVLFQLVNIMRVKVDVNKLKKRKLNI